ncbi:RNF26 ligase, partial [Bucco capensis]|nr:RNF26 ligase [Bucco capensis]
MLFALLRGLRIALDLLVLVLDVNFFLVSSIVSALLWLLAAVCSLLAAALACWDGLLLSLAFLAQAAGRLALGALQGLGGLLHTACCSLEGLKVVGHLLSHLALRSRELLHRELCGLLGCGQALARQVGEGLAIGTSLLAYLINSLINVCLIGTQNLFTLLVDSVTIPFLRVTDLLAAFLAHISSGAIAVSILLWSPCQLAFQLLTSVAELFIRIFFVNIYGLGLLLLIIAVSAIVFNPGLLWTLTNYVLPYFNTLPFYQRLQQELWRLYEVAALTLGMVLTSQAWRRLVEWSLQVTNWSQGGRTRNRGSNQRGAPGPVPRPAVPGRLMMARLGQLPGEHEEQQDVEQQIPQARPALSRSTAAGRRLPREEPSTSWGKAAGKQQLNAAAGDAEATLENDPWMLLKEQEERKKCVICQDQTKTVLLLPCRHLCLCQECTEVLLQQAIYQRNCPLCRQMIFQTLNVYL